MTPRPILFNWSGTAMEPRGGFRRVCDDLFAVGETYRMEVIEERSVASHNFYFACIHDAWMSLPEGETDRYPTEEHLRKFALIKSGFADERSFVCTSKAEAVRLAAFIKPIDEYAIIVVSEATVKVYTAQSQSKRAMGAKKFQESKSKVLDLISSMVGTSRAELEAQA